MFFEFVFFSSEGIRWKPTGYERKGGGGLWFFLFLSFASGGFFLRGAGKEGKEGKGKGKGNRDLI